MPIDQISLGHRTEAFSFYRWNEYRSPQLDMVETMRDRRALSPKWAAIQSLPSLREPRRRGVINVTNQWG